MSHGGLLQRFGQGDRLVNPDGSPTTRFQVATEDWVEHLEQVLEAVEGAALTRTNDTNVTLTLGGSPTTALLAATSLTLGWTGTLAVARGGTGAGTAAGARTNLGVTATGADTTYAFRANNLSDLANASTARTNLGLGTAAIKNTGTSGDAVPLLNAANTWSATQTIANSAPSFALQDSDTSGAASTQQIQFLDSGGANRAVISHGVVGNGILDIVNVSNNGIQFRSASTLCLSMNSTSVSPVSATTASAANVHQASSGSALLRSTSSQRYKTDITALADAEADKVLDLEPVTYRSKAVADNPNRLFWGFTAEQADEVLPVLVNYDVQGQPDSFQYERVIVGLVSVVKRLEARVAALEAV